MTNCETNLKRKQTALSITIQFTKHKYEKREPVKDAELQAYTYRMLRCLACLWALKPHPHLGQYSVTEQHKKKL